VLYTDAEPESVNHARGSTAGSLCWKPCSELSSQEVLAAVTEEVRQFSPHEQPDDITLMVLKWSHFSLMRIRACGLLAFFLAAHHAFLACEMRFRAAALIVGRFRDAEPELDAPLGGLVAAHRAFIAWEIRRLASTLSTLRLRGADAPPGGLPRLRPPTRAVMAALRRSRSAFSSVRMVSRVKWNPL
jgi:hypothetical protein